MLWFLKAWLKRFEVMLDACLLRLVYRLTRNVEEVDRPTERLNDYWAVLATGAEFMAELRKIRHLLHFLSLAAKFITLIFTQLHSLPIFIMMIRMELIEALF